MMVFLFACLFWVLSGHAQGHLVGGDGVEALHIFFADSSL
jgi:hypothetical protein